MKKFLLFFAAIYCSALVNAQLTLEYETTHNIVSTSQGSSSSGTKIYANFSHVFYRGLSSTGQSTGYTFSFLGNFIEYDDDIIDLDTYSLVEKPDFNSIKDELNPNYSYMKSYCFAKGYFTNDNRICYIAIAQLGSNRSIYDDYQHLYLIDENGAVLQDLGSAKDLTYGFVALNNGTYNFYIFRHFRNNTNKLEIYSMPGNGITTEVQNIQAPNHNHRKYIKNDQVLIESNDRLYNMQGNYINYHQSN